MAPTDDPATLFLETFAGREGDTFQIELDDGTTIDLVLAEVSAWGPPVAPGERQPFTLLFTGPIEPVLPQQIYRFADERGASFEIFIVPVGPQAGRMQYEAVFN